MGKLASVAGTVAGGLIGGPAGASIGGALGGMIGGTPDVSGMYSNAAGQYGQNAQMAQFRPVGITTNFGTSRFTVNPQTGQLESAGYSLSPELQALQGRLMSGYGNALTQAEQLNTAPLTQTAQSLFNLGQGYIAQSPEEARQRYITQQQALLAPQQEQALSNVRNRLFQSGRAGLATSGTTTGMAQTNPEMAAYYNALAQQQAQLAAGAEQAAQQQQAYGIDVFGKGVGLMSQVPTLQTAYYGPLTTQLGLGQTIESLGQQPLDISAQLAGRSATAGKSAADIANLGVATSLAGSKAQADINAAQQLSLNQAVGGLFGGSSGGSNTGASNWFNSILNAGATSF
jgi:hypothetical protein